jgi:hypothetical protein
VARNCRIVARRKVQWRELGVAQTMSHWWRRRFPAGEPSRSHHIVGDATRERSVDRDGHLIRQAVEQAAEGEQAEGTDAA